MKPKIQEGVRVPKEEIDDCPKRKQTWPACCVCVRASVALRSVNVWWQLFGAAAAGVETPLICWAAVSGWCGTRVVWTTPR